ncbi:nuclear protein localization 4 [Anaeramoeba flamelloides]|uniref:Nuclear protein localization 4 n=1 Tax=Anaeramoeba flamelloides TaxID=1746091 RepID=A0ABQ8YRE0_9EUKA|nr:nuclear protein localization 4 [Anaeramoeba flamelloides]
MIIRVRTNLGMERFTITDDITLGQFYELISKKMQLDLKYVAIENEKHVVFKDSQKGVKLSELGFENGSIVYLKPKLIDREKIEREKLEKEIEEKEHEEENKWKFGGLEVEPNFEITKNTTEEEILELEKEWDLEQEKENKRSLYDRLKEGKIKIPYHIQKRQQNLGKHSLSMAVIDWLEETKPKISHQEKGHCIGVEFDHQSGNVFHTFLRNSNYDIPRVGYLFGTVNPDESVTVDFIYEPPQKVLRESQRVSIIENEEELNLMIKISEFLGLKPVGWIVGHKPRKSKRKLLKAWQIIQAARVQARFGHHAVTIVACPRKSGKAQFEAFQVSDQTVQLMQQKSVRLSSRGYTLDFFQSVIVEKDKKLSAGSYFFMITIPIIIHKSPLKISFFVENRGPWNRGDLNVYLMTNKEKSWEEKLSDPHLLLFLAKMEIFSMRTDFPKLCSQIKNKEKITSGFTFLLENFQL